MIRLNQTASQFLSLITAQNGANVVVNYSDDSATGYAGDSQVTNIATATTTTICATPAAATIRDIDHISIHNTFAGNHALTLQVSSSGTLYPLHTFTLSSGDSFEYTHGSGWKVIDSNGATKSAGVFSSATPLMNGVAAVGTEAAASRGDHVHPSDTSREAIANKDVAGGYVGKDANSNLAINNANLGFTSIATAAGTTTLTVSSTYQQYFTGTTTQTVVMPLLSTLALGQAYLLDNDSTGIVTVNANAADAGTATQLPLLMKNGEFARISKKSTTEWSVDISAKRGGDSALPFAASAISSTSRTNTGVDIDGLTTLTTTLAATFAGAANEKLDIYMTGTQAFSGFLEVTVTATFNATNATGGLRKVFGIGCSAGGSIFANESRYAEASDLTATAMAISDFSWDAANSRYKITLVNRSGALINPKITVRAFAALSASLTNISTITAGTPYTTDATVYAKPVVNYSGLKIGATGMLSTGPIGFDTGAGGTVTQATSRTTGVTLSKVSGAITLFSAAGSVTPTTFTVTNTTVAATDTPIVVQKSGTDLYIIHVTAVAAGSFNITFWTTGGTTTEQPVFNFNIIKGVAA